MTDEVDAWMITLLPKLLETYNPENIYNQYKTGLLYKLQSNPWSLRASKILVTMRTAAKQSSC